DIMPPLAVLAGSLEFVQFSHEIEQVHFEGSLYFVDDLIQEKMVNLISRCATPCLTTSLIFRTPGCEATRFCCGSFAWIGRQSASSSLSRGREVEQPEDATLMLCQMHRMNDTA